MYRIGVWNLYEELTTNGFLFKNPEAAIGASLLKPWCDLYAYGQQNDIDFITLDQVASVSDLDAVIFIDRPLPGKSFVDEAMRANIRKYLILCECEVIRPDNWDINYHRLFDRVFTWSDVHVDGRRYMKMNFTTDLASPYDFDTLKSVFNQRKLVTLIAGAKMSSHPYELYSERVRAIRWFEASAPRDFDLYGMGWNAEAFPSYRGSVQDKLGTLMQYRFLLCLENARNIPGYITGKFSTVFARAWYPSMAVHQISNVGSQPIVLSISINSRLSTR